MGSETAAAGLGLGGGLQLRAWLPPLHAWLVLYQDIPLRYMTAARGDSRSPIAETPEDAVATSHLPTSI